MAKKYVPSGYQIIDIDASDKSSGVAFTPATEDEKLLLELLQVGKKIVKPILLHVIDPNNDEWVGFPTQLNSELTLSDGVIGASTQLYISASSTQLTIVAQEE